MRVPHAEDHATSAIVPSGPVRSPADGGLPILHLVAPGENGGLERVVHALAIGHHRRGQAVAVAATITDGREDHPFLAPLVDAGVPVFPLFVPARGYAEERRAVAALCERLQPRVVHTHGYRPDVLSASVARTMGIATVTTVHGFTGGGFKNRFYEWLQRRAFRRFDAVVAVSRPLAQQLEAHGVPRARIHLLPNAWADDRPLRPRAEARRTLGLAEGRLHVGWVGRLSREKGPDVLVRALTGLPDLPVRVSFLGDGCARTALQTLAEGLGVTERIAWHGAVPGAGRLLGAFDCFVLSSRTEGTPIVLFEAMAAGVPVVATAVGGVPDIVSEAEALLVPPGDPARLAAAIRDALTDREAAAARAQAARRRLETEFQLQPWLECHVELYARLTEKSSQRVSL